MNCEDLRSIYRCETNQKTRVEASIKFLQEYMNTYKYSTCCSGNGNVFADDILYGLGVALDPENYSFALGYSKFKQDLLMKLQDDESRLKFKGE